jgi:hypothetical protein
MLVWDGGDAAIVGYNDPRDLSRSYDVTRQAPTLDAMSFLLADIAGEAAA